MSARHTELLKKLLYYSGYTSLYEFISAPSENRLLILMYHDVVTESEQLAHWYSSDTPNTSQLEALIVAMKRHYRVITVEDAVLEILNTGKIQTKSVALTFDDGYVGTHSLLYPLLRKHDIPATIYLPTNWIDGKISPWWLLLNQYVDECSIDSHRIAGVEKIIAGFKVNVTWLAKQPNKFKAVLRDQLGGILMKMEDKVRDQVMHDLRATLIGDSPLLQREQLVLNWTQIKEMAAYGIRFGAHSCSHRNLSFLDLEAADMEIGESKRVIQQRLGVEAVGFAYPYGYDVNGYRRLRPLFEKHDYLYACTSWWGHVDAGCDRYLLARTCLAQTNSTAVFARVLGLEYCTKQWPRPVGLEEWPLHTKSSD